MIPEMINEEDLENDCRVINLPEARVGPAMQEHKFWLEENSAAAKRSLMAK